MDLVVDRTFDRLPRDTQNNKIIIKKKNKKKNKKEFDRLTDWCAV